MFLKNGQFGPCRPLSGDWAGQVCKLSAAGRNVRTARERPSHVRSQQWKSEDPWLSCPSLWKATSAQHNLQEGYGFTVSGDNLLLKETLRLLSSVAREKRK